MARVLAFVLLVLVTNTATAEIVHRHGNLLPASSAGAAAFRDANTDQTTTDGSRSTGECLICQLHQHLFTTLLINVPGIAAPQAEETHVAKTFISFASEASMPERGRAPPRSPLL